MRMSPEPPKPELGDPRPREADDHQGDAGDDQCALHAIYAAICYTGTAIALSARTISTAEIGRVKKMPMRHPR